MNLPNHPDLYDSGALLDDVEKAKSRVVDFDVLEVVLKELKDLRTRLQSAPDWQAFTAFWPPRLVEAYKARQLIVFFGAGVSAASGIPSWTDLLSKYFQLSQPFLEDPDLTSDPLTMAEVASQQLGAQRVQSILRELMTTKTTPTTAHIFLAALRCPVYITTNYDTLWEAAWKIVNPHIDYEVVVNDADVAKLAVDASDLTSNTERCLLIKLHGSVEKNEEHLILTRRDYRSHYRFNDNLISAVRTYLQSRHTLFVGFSHRDPEASRLVEDAIYAFENPDKRPMDVSPGLRPHFYSLQFNMLRHTPEIFAARGLVALAPPVSASTVGDVRSIALSNAVGQLIVAQYEGIHEKESLDRPLQESADQIATPLSQGLDMLKHRKDDALKLIQTSEPSSVLEELLSNLGMLASQGVYVLNRQGRMVDSALPPDLDPEERRTKTTSFLDRPYFRLANTFGQAFVSDSFESVFNRLSTIFLCVPLIEDPGRVFRGLLFSATQIGSWELPIEVARPHWAEGRSFALVDSNGVALLPPNDEFDIEANNHGYHDKELPSANRGYSFNRLRALSRRDALISNVVQNIVPLTQDDDVLDLPPDLRYYSVVTEIKGTRWKLAISKPLVSASA